MSIDEALSCIPQSGAKILMGGFVGASEPTCCITNEPGMSGIGRAKLYEQGLVSEIISSHVGTTEESTNRYLEGSLKVEQYYPMGTLTEKIRAGAMGLGGVLVPVGVGILDEPGLFPELKEPKQVMNVNGMDCFVEPAIRAPFAIIKAWRADKMGNLQFRYTGLNCNAIYGMAGDYTIAEVEEIVEVGEIPPDRVGCPGPFVNAVVQGLSLKEHDELYRQHWLKIGKLKMEDEEGNA